MITGIEFTHAGRPVVVRKNDSHPEYYLWIDVSESHYFLGVLEDGMTRGDVRRMADRWLASRGGRTVHRSDVIAGVLRSVGREIDDLT
jgi:hypothetical protein